MSVDMLGHAATKLSRVVFSSMSDHWSTPSSVYDALNNEFGFTFDPCPLESDSDGLTVQWTGNVFCNPPYSKIPSFIRKGLYHLGMRDCRLLVFLVPARTDTDWFHRYVIGLAEIRFIKGRLKFGGAKTSAPFPSMVCIWRDYTLDDHAPIR